jgi:3-hydroxyacyl-CoA dehydrogenase
VFLVRARCCFSVPFQWCDHIIHVWVWGAYATVRSPHATPLTVRLYTCTISRRLPGGQGTQRLPRLIGADAAIEMMTSGNHITAEQALHWKVVDSVAPAGGSLVAAAKTLCKSKFGLPLPKVCDMPPPSPTDFAKVIGKLAKTRPGEIAPAAIVRCVEAACTSPTFQAGDATEKREFAILVKSPESAALRHMFFSERAGSKVNGLKVKPAKIGTVGIIGAGLMGGA